ncbi:centrosomal protein of 162 kDa-like isoform X5 [Bufo bufo]|uniref:centrosomal protein of 162 kDa-like isoform X5 n=1 Tax=Bufo bufo TaxID=8384 RepID=UPI001ABDC9E2|nr:centrosomal protein of 162 kDa-like isoform X5 [Bufo bufo]
MSFRTRNKVVVGISSRSSEEDLRWLMEFIRGTFLELVSDVKYLPITNNNFLEWKDEMRRCSVGILYHTKRHGRINIVDVDGALYHDELQSLYNTLGKSKVLVVVDDLENCSDSERERILDTQSSLRHRSSQLLLFPETGKIEEAKKKKEEFLKFLGNNAGGEDLQVNTKNPEGGLIWKSIKDRIPGASFFSSGFSPFSSHQNSRETSSDPKQNYLSKGLGGKRKSRLKVIIFSRSAQSNYEWLMEWLKTKCVMRPIDVHAFCITNNSTRFYSELPNCSFAILYHTQKQGRLNVTDVTDSLYNEELKELSAFLGRENVIVVIDDLQNTDYTKKNQILRNQPSISRLAWDLYLFNELKKNPENLKDIQRILMGKIEKIQDDEEWAVVDTDFLQDDSGRKPSEPDMSAMGLQQEAFQDSSVDNEPASSGTSSTKSTKEGDLSAARVRKGADDLNGPEAKNIILDPSISTLHEVDSALQDQVSSSFLVYKKSITTNAKWQEHRNITQARFTEMSQKIQKLQSENEELQSQNRRLLREKNENEDAKKQVVEACTKIMKEREGTIEMLHKDLRDKERIIEQERGRIQNMEQKIEELMKELREKKAHEMQTRKENLQQNLHDKDRTTEVEHNTIQNMEQVIQQRKSYIHEIENKPNQEMETRKSNRYEERSPVPGQEDEEKTQHEHRQCKRRTEMMDEGFLWDTTKGNIDARFNHRERSEEIQSLTLANDQIKQLKNIIQQKDEEIQMLKAEVHQKVSALEAQAALIDDLLNASESWKEKATR